jgi:hypothetical protein
MGFGHHRQQSGCQRTKSGRAGRHRRRDSVKAVVIIDGGKTFIAGADIDAYGI